MNRAGQRSKSLFIISRLLNGYCVMHTILKEKRKIPDSVILWFSRLSVNYFFKNFYMSSIVRHLRAYIWYICIYIYIYIYISYIIANLYTYIRMYMYVWLHNYWKEKNVFLKSQTRKSPYAFRYNTGICAFPNSACLYAYFTSLI